MSTIAAGNTLTTGFVASSDTTGNLVFQTNGTTTALTLTTSQNATLANNVSVVGSVTSVNTFGFENRIINGAMMIDQRWVGTSITPTGGSYLVDRWVFLPSLASKFSLQQNAGSVTPPTGFVNYLGATSLSSYSVGASDYFLVSQPIEGLNVADLGWGTASAKTVTLSFWARSSLTGTFGGSISNNGYAYTYPFSYSIPVANTWTQISITIAGPTSGTWLKTNGIGIQINFSLGTGSTFSGTASTWAATSYYSATGATSVAGTNGATWYVTGVQFEVGTQATSFDFRSYGTELALCQRYYQKSVDQSTAVGTAVGDIRKYPNIDIPVSIAGQALSLYCWFKTTMRTAPTIAYYDGAGTVSKITGIASSTAQTNGITLNDVQATDNGVQFRAYDIPYYGFGLYYTASAEL